LKPFERIIMRIRAIATTTAALLFMATPSTAVPTADFGVDIYMSAPFVQGPAVSTGLATENFNLAPAGACPTTISIGTVSGDCTVSAVSIYGGASADANNPAPTTGGAGSYYASTAAPSTEITIDLDEPAKYLGMWWSAGSPSNIVELYSGADRVASMTTATLMTLLTGATVGSVGGPTYDTDDYRGNPRNGSAPTEPFLYLNLYATGGASFDRIVLSGGGFEFDNIAVSDLEQTPTPYQVGVEFIAGENEPPAEEEEGAGEEAEAEVLAATGFDNYGLFGFGLLAVAIGAIALRRRSVR
jgi:hypothetical protein